MKDEKTAKALNPFVFGLYIGAVAGILYFAVWILFFSLKILSP